MQGGDGSPAEAAALEALDSGVQPNFNEIRRVLELFQSSVQNYPPEPLEARKRPRQEAPDGPGESDGARAGGAADERVHAPGEQGPGDEDSDVLGAFRAELYQAVSHA